MLFSVSLIVALLAVPIFTLCLITLSWRKSPLHRAYGRPSRILIVLGSGGHTAEMLAALRDLDTTKYAHRSYLVSSGDAFSALKAMEFERGLRDVNRSRVKLEDSGSTTQGGHGSYGGFDIAIVPRARRIHQGLLTTPFTSLWCMLVCFGILKKPGPDANNTTSHMHLTYPDLILSNGPATAVIVVVASLVLRLSCLPGTRNKMRTVYIESWARVRTLSLSGKILVHVVDRFLVQWEGLLASTNGKGEYLGVLV